MNDLFQERYRAPAIHTITTIYDCKRTFDNDSAETLLALMDALAAERVIGDTVAVIQKKRPFLFSLFTHA